MAWKGSRLREKPEGGAGDKGYDAILLASSAEVVLEIVINAKARITPQTALSVAENMQRLTAAMLRVVYAPVISPRVAEILDQAGVGRLDAAGNCRLRSARHRLLSTGGDAVPAALPQGSADPFSPKSSRIVRAMLSEPAKGWKVRELADHPDVNVSPGLVVKVKRTLVEESYVAERRRPSLTCATLWGCWRTGRKLCGSCGAGAHVFPGRGRGGGRGGRQLVPWNGLEFALAGFSAAWRLSRGPL